MNDTKNEDSRFHNLLYDLNQRLGDHHVFEVAAALGVLNQQAVSAVIDMAKDEELTEEDRSLTRDALAGMSVTHAQLAIMCRDASGEDAPRIVVPGGLTS